MKEPENQLYPELLEELAEEFRLYSEDVGKSADSSSLPGGRSAG